MKELIQHTGHVNELLARYGVKFGIYKNNIFNHCTQEENSSIGR